METIYGNTHIGFWGQVSIGDAESCWLWTGSTDSNSGYGLARLKLTDKKPQPSTAHRIAIISLLGEKIDGFDVGHRCKSRNCVNPNHLYITSEKENLREMVSRDKYLYPFISTEDGMNSLIEKARSYHARYKISKMKVGDMSDDQAIKILLVMRGLKEFSDREIEIMPCGHSVRYIVSDNEGTHACLMCEYNELLSTYRKLIKTRVFIDPTE